jgi:hypothetical protein
MISSSSLIFLLVLSMTAAVLQQPQQPRLLVSVMEVEAALAVIPSSTSRGQHWQHGRSSNSSGHLGFQILRCPQYELLASFNMAVLVLLTATAIAAATLRWYDLLFCSSRSSTHCTQVSIIQFCCIFLKLLLFSQLDTGLPDTGY